MQQERSEGTPYGAQAAAADQLEAFRQARLAQAEVRLDQAVADGQLTQEEADARIAAMEARSAECDGTGANQGEGGLRLGKMGGGNGTGSGEGKGYRGAMGGRGTGQAGANCPAD